jgi:hypothetical protein
VNRDRSFFFKFGIVFFRQKADIVAERKEVLEKDSRYEESGSHGSES